MPVKSASTEQVFKWALGHITVILTGVAIIGSGYLAFNRFQVQWQEHVAPNCKETPTASVCRIEQLDRKVDRMEQKLDQIMLIAARRK